MKHFRYSTTYYRRKKQIKLLTTLRRANSSDAETLVDKDNFIDLSFGASKSFHNSNEEEMLMN